MDAIPLPHLLSRLSGELAALHRMAAEIEATVDGLVEEGARPLGADEIRTLQLLDILGQTLQALSAFAANAALLSSSRWLVDGPATVTGITLAGIAQRLAGDGASHPAQPEGYELFSEG